MQHNSTHVVLLGSPGKSCPLLSGSVYRAVKTMGFRLSAPKPLSKTHHDLGINPS